MSRKDTIIIAVLLNACVLALLFMLAVNTDEEKVSDRTEIVTETMKFEDKLDAGRHDLALSSDPAEEDDMDSHIEGAVGQSHDIYFPDDDTVVFAEKETPKSGGSLTGSSYDKDEVIEVTIKRGDALERIARVNGSSVEAIKALNNLKTERLNIGQVLRVPVTGIPKKNEDKVSVASVTPASTPKISEVKPVSTMSTTASNKDVVYYTLKSGDSPWKIAKQFSVNFDDLLNMNHLDEEKARNLKIGDKLRVR